LLLERAGSGEEKQRSNQQRERRARAAHADGVELS